MSVTELRYKARHPFFVSLKSVHQAGSQILNIERVHRGSDSAYCCSHIRNPASLSDWSNQ
jgi:hypothetical protein